MSGRPQDGAENMKVTHEEARYRGGLLGRRCGNCAMFRDLDMAVHVGGQSAAALPDKGQGRDEYDERSADAGAERNEPPPSCTVVASPIAPRDLCDYFQELS
jgi:hypothetical protein